MASSQPSTDQAEGRAVSTQLRELRPLLLVIYLPTLAGIGLLIAVNVAADVPLRSFFIDPVAEFNAPAYIGLVSNFGVVLWASVASIGLFGAWLLLGHPGSRETFLFLTASGLISALLLFDDLYLLHEEVLPERLLIPQPIVFAIYGVAVAGFVYRFRRLIHHSDYALLLLAAGFFAASIAIDVFVTPEEFRLVGDLQGRHLVEDGLKLLGIVTWTAYFWRTSLNLVRGSLYESAR